MRRSNRICFPENAIQSKQSQPEEKVLEQRKQNKQTIKTI